MRRKEAPPTGLEELPEWVVGVAPPPPGVLPPVPPVDPAWGFTEAEWARVHNDEARARARRDWLARNAPHLTSRELWERRRDLLAGRTYR